MKWNAARFTLCLVFVAAGCGDRRVPVGWWHAGGSAGMNPGMGGQGGAAGMAGAGGSVMPPPAGTPACQSPAPMPVRTVLASAPVMAQRLARLIWLAEADGSLVMQATALRTSADVAALARNMLTDPRSADGMRALAQSWLHSNDALTATARAGAAMAATPQLRNSMVHETGAFLHNLIAVTGGNLEHAFTSNLSFIDRSLGEIYGVTGPASGFAAQMLPPNERSGVLTHAGALFAHPLAPQRGQWIRETLMCQPVPPPPAGTSVPVMQAPGVTSRQAHEAEMKQPACASCHQLIDPLGFALEHYDVLGRFRATDNGKPVDSTAVIHELDDAMVTDAGDLGHELAASCAVQTCTARVFLAQALGRPALDLPEGTENDVTRAFAAASFDLRELLLATVQSAGFLNN